MLKSAQEVVASGNVGEAVDFAIEANRQIASLTKELEALKVFLRSQGLSAAALTGKNSASLEGTLGTAEIVCVKAVPKAKKGVDLLACEAGIAPEIFSALFVKKTVVDFADDYETKFAALPTAAKTVIGNLVTMVASTPRVNLPK